MNIGHRCRLLGIRKLGILRSFANFVEGRVERPELLDAFGSIPGVDGAMSVLAKQARDRPGQLGKVTLREVSS